MAKACWEENPIAYEKLVSPSGLYFIQQVKTWQGDSVVWWEPMSSGYTYRIDRAGIYEEEHARQIECSRGEDWAIPVEIAHAATTKHVVGHDLRAAIRTSHGGHREAMHVHKGRAKAFAEAIALVERESEVVPSPPLCPTTEKT